jgi:three-Cys-motif partner protein
VLEVQPVSERQPSRRDKGHRFGGNWTTIKLDLVAKYLLAYTRVMSRTGFRTTYVDAFAGSGYRDPTRGPMDASSTTPVFPGFDEPTSQESTDGSARIALKTQPPFDRYIFIEKNRSRCAQLEALRLEFSDLATRITVHAGDANAEIRKLCQQNWDRDRAVLFLDPYGLQVEWESIRSIAYTKAIDLWLLFPLGIGVGRLLTKSGDIPDEWRRCLDKLLGSSNWFEEFYRIDPNPDLYGHEQQLLRAPVEEIGRYFLDRLRTLFPAVADHPRVLSNSTHSPMYLLCFAAGNARGAPIALRIANHLLKKGAN